MWDKRSIKCFRMNLIFLTLFDEAVVIECESERVLHAAWHVVAAYNRADYCSSSQPSRVESQKTIPREEQCSEWWQLKGNKPIIKTSKVAMGEASIPATLITPEQTSVTSTRCTPGVFFFSTAFFLNYWNFTFFPLVLYEHLTKM